ncbi:outer membrane protein assembly factor BamC [Endothiovibrio diazotrophicus]
MSVEITVPRLIVLAPALLLAACGSMPKVDEMVTDRQVEYKQSREGAPLEVPPDLTSSTLDDTMQVPDINPASTATYSAYSGERSGARVLRDESVLPKADNVRVERAGDKRWLVIQGTPDQVWPKMREFWLSNGWLIKMEDPRIGVLETDWAENRADIPQDAIRGFLSKMVDSLYSAGSRDKYRVRLERGSQPGTTELYLTHRGAEEVVEGETTVWQARANDPELEAEMLGRMMVYFGVDRGEARNQLARQAPRATRARMMRAPDGSSALGLEEGFDRAWRRTGVALDRVGFTVEDRNRALGVYFVRYNDPLREEAEKEGWLSKLAFWKSDEVDEAKTYQVAIKGDGERSRILVLDGDGNPDGGSTAKRILTLLYEQLK